jgi:chemotaxis protein MotB
MQRRVAGHHEGWLLSYADLITNLLLFFVLFLSAAKLSKTKLQQIAKSVSGSQSAASLESIQQEINQKIVENHLENMVRTDLSDEGLELSLSSGVVFDSGRAQIRPEWESALSGMLQVLVPYAGGYNFAVEGHTDNVPFAAGGGLASNWELSCARAIVVRARLEGVGIDRRRIRVEAYADTKPIPETALLGLDPEERLARHRRVIVRVY